MKLLHVHNRKHPFAPVVMLIKKNVLMFVALLAALVTMVIIPPDKEYLKYFAFKTLPCVFCVLAVVCAQKTIRFF